MIPLPNIVIHFEVKLDLGLQIGREQHIVTFERGTSWRLVPQYLEEPYVDSLFEMEEINTLIRKRVTLLMIGLLFTLPQGEIYITTEEEARNIPPCVIVAAT